MADPTVLLALAARAEAGGDATLSDDCWRAAGWVERVEWNGVSWKSPDGRRIFGRRPDLQTSIDVQAELPGRIVYVSVVQKSDGVEYFEAYAEALVTGEDASDGTARNETLARLAAKLRSLAAAQKESGGG